MTVTIHWSTDKQEDSVPFLPQTFSYLLVCKCLTFAKAAQPCSELVVGFGATVALNSTISFNICSLLTLGIHIPSQLTSLISPVVFYTISGFVVV